MDEKQDVNQGKKVVGVPESIESCYLVQWWWQLPRIPSEPPRSKCECDYHQHHHSDPSGADHFFQKPRVGGLTTLEISSNQLEFLRCRSHNAGEVAG